jgi:putative transposase
MIKRKSYDTRVKYLVRKGLLPDLYRKRIHRSLISKWKRESPEKYTGYELNNDIGELYELMKTVSEDERMIKALKAFYRIILTLKKVIGSGKDYINKLRDHKYIVIDSIQKTKKVIGLKRAVKLFGIGESTYRVWAMESYFRCHHSITKLCNSSYPQQLTPKEIHKMHRMLSNEHYLHWPIISVAYYGMKKASLKAHPNTWYKYARLMKIKRKIYRKPKVRYETGIRASAPNEKWHADVTEIKTADGKTSFIYLVMDNFSRYITSWRVSDKICAQTRLETFAETIHNAGIKPSVRRKKRTGLIVDGGSENNNKIIGSFMEKYPVKKLVALKDILKSNSMVESLNRTLKYNYLFPKHIYDQDQLIKTLHKDITDYNDKRPHGSLFGLTPLEAYGKKKVNFKQIRENMIQAHDERVHYNRTHSCYGCPFGCKQ